MVSLGSTLSEGVDGRKLRRDFPHFRLSTSAKLPICEYSSLRGSGDG